MGRRRRNIVNLIAGAISLWVSRVVGARANLRYFFWILAALNLLPGAGYFIFSGMFGFGDWQEVIRGLPNQVPLRIMMTMFGAALYVAVVRLIAVAVRPFCSHRQTYNIVGRLPYYAACLFSCAAGLFDPLGVKLFLVSKRSLRRSADPPACCGPIASFQPSPHDAHC